MTTRRFLYRLKSLKDSTKGERIREDKRIMQMRWSDASAKRCKRCRKKVEKADACSDVLTGLGSRRA